MVKRKTRKKKTEKKIKVSVDNILVRVDIIVSQNWLTSKPKLQDCKA